MNNRPSLSKFSSIRNLKFINRNPFYKVEIILKLRQGSRRTASES